MKYYAIKHTSTGEYYSEILYHSEVGYYPMFTKDIENSYTHCMKARFDKNMLIEVYSMNTDKLTIVPIKFIEEERGIEIDEYYITK